MNEFFALDLEQQIAAMTAVARAGLSRWPGRFEEISLVKYRENAVFRLRDSHGKQFALRVHRSGYHSDAELVSELRWMSLLAKSSIEVPAVIPAIDGSIFVKAHAPGGPGPLQVDMLAWFEGEQLGSIEAGFSCSLDELKELYQQVGRLAARLHEHAAAWQRPANFTRHAWDAQGLLGPAPFWGQFRDLPDLSADLPLIEEACRKAQQDLSALGQSSEVYGLIHADLVPENILRSGNRLVLIDFDDAGFGWHMFELATALFWHTDRPYYRTVHDALLVGYRSVRKLSESQWQQLPLFLYLRSLTYLGWVWTRSETETARELTPMLVEKTRLLATEYLMDSASARPDFHSEISD
jgi:Ser/Thr protein kinase RdoA (MazF antagonist)